MNKTVLTTALIALTLSVSAGAVAPQNTVYEVAITLRNFEDGETVVGQDCARFKTTELCFDDLGSCGPLTLLENKGRRQRWSAVVPMVDADGTKIDAVLHGVTEPRGRGSAIAATAIAIGIDDAGTKVRQNASIAGVAVTSCAVDSNP